MIDSLLSLWLPVVAVASALAGMCAAALATYFRLSAERNYSLIIQSVRAAQVRALYVASLEDGKLDEAEIEQLTQELMNLALSLDRRERTFVVDALKQPSYIGRERYISKLLQPA